jgi:aspartate/methionine/tyrosine aminotransferase
VLALCVAPFILDNPTLAAAFPKDAVARAKKLLESFKGGVGAYQDSRGNPLVRQEVADFIGARDGVPSNPNVRQQRVVG